MSEASPALDEAFDRMAASGFELPNGFVYHGPMACEALAALGCYGEIDGWARRMARGGAAVEPVVPEPFAWEDALGDYQRLPEWIGYFEGEMADQGWSAVVGAWIPRLMPAFSVLLYHGAIRTAHAVRAIDAADTQPRRAELARALGYWAAASRDPHQVKLVEACRRGFKTTGDRAFVAAAETVTGRPARRRAP